jgi:prepilin-type N-terminal cleavage/methylation domain-containing protein
MKIPSIQKHQAGFQLVEVLIVLAVLGVIAILVVPKFLNSGSKAKLNAQNQNTVGALQSAISLETADLGLLPVNSGPGKIFQSRLKAKNLQAVTLDTNLCNNPPLNRPIGNHGYKLPSGVVVVTDDTWDDYNYRAGSAEKVMGRQACLLLKGLDSDPAKGEVVYTTFYRDGQADAALAVEGETEGELAESGNVTTTSTNIEEPPLVNTCNPTALVKAKKLLADYAQYVAYVQLIKTVTIANNGHFDQLSYSGRIRWVKLLN